jgi:hypothetical protein
MEISITLRGDFERELAGFVAVLAEDVFQDAKANTPIRSGNARRNWTKTVSSRSAVVENKVPYIERLEAGYSKQAPRGILGPTLTQIKGKYK